jgi:hypothetical protein
MFTWFTILEAGNPRSSDCILYYVIMLLDNIMGKKKGNQVYRKEVKHEGWLPFIRLYYQGN